MRLGFLFVLLFSLSAYGQDSSKTLPIIPKAGHPNYKIKVNLFDQSVFSLPCIKVHNEILVGGQASSNYNYISADLGYNYYSQDEFNNKNIIIKKINEDNICINLNSFLQRFF